ncbi:UDP-N-acetylmuramoylalanyl-D-glutamyl-2,6-diaminopimelate--D-alanyl-D-alanine ligase [Nitrospirillum viridazoti]|uniref:UDP-N-acetylmuramoyl-tripeptide--D-alanyl-D-alanine ligase n=1 Tax=Nitrospirillum viridazoti CBAmc TaxID=1441467 RepID=A0A248JQY7_9PROT|nr:UDP-N-acetylmuramoylalanyl-D-glutamyl-2,6-diaminopimelate--D-alanyl-D-alanine ligase [Nitrospirillum amazonense]ASG21117.1 UDP-N-acetylmuramoylalanyl-D-glutamyl-2, 6-diaminopimelate--D-alanyl-D-alanine ligase [Nitrospirillum amazonense CBAmc]TWB28094.1 UDP-N-acetylmuramoyl-tripeptide--D-alanyl-D-alanine ligase [Nitrospirillum amazonense]
MTAATPTKTVLWTAADAAAAANGRAQGADWAATGVSINTRTLNPGDLFVALKGPNFDGHAFVGTALERGAAACLVSQVPDGLAADAPLLVVDDTLAALEDLARVARLNTTAKVIAVTGSVGKTSTKEFLRTALGALGPTFATEGNLNNHLGLPLSLASLPADVRFGVFELGMNHAGEIGPLSRMARPDIAIITTVEAVHLEFFASVESIADAKAEIFEGMSRQGTAILNRDNPQYARLLAAARTQGVGHVLSFGATAGADARLIDLDLGPTGSDVTAEIQGQVIRYTLAVPGHHQALNSLAVLLAVSAAGGDLAVAGQALATLAPVKGRGVRQAIPLPGGGSLTLVDESYNASPVSVAASADVLGHTQPDPGGRRVAVLGDMLELGPDSPKLHAGLADALVAADVHLVFTCGPNMRHLFDRLPPERRGAHADTSAELAPLVGAAVRANDIVMVKGSAGSRMALVVDALKALDNPPPSSSSSAVSGS